MHTTSLKAWHDDRGAVWKANEVQTYGSTRSEWRAIDKHVGLFDASAKDRLLVTGADRTSFVQSLCTNDIEKAGVGSGIETAFITPKGKLVADARVVQLDDALLLEMENGRAAALIELFGRYQLHEDCAFTDASEDLSQLELWGDAALALGESIADGEVRVTTLGDGAYLTCGTAFGAIVFVPVDVSQEAAQALVDNGATPVGREAVDVRRIELGLGRYGIDWSETTNPLVAGLDRMLSYNKGCYVGQEVVVKATDIGHVNRRLVRLEWAGEAVDGDTALIGGRAPGVVTSSARVPESEEQRVVALGIVRRDVTAPGTTLKLGDENGPDVTVVGWPWRSKDKPR